MADLDVQPRKKSSAVPWIIAGVVLLVLLFLLARGCNVDPTDTVAEGPDTIHTDATRATTSDSSTTDKWYNVNLDAPAVSYDELSKQDVETRGDDRFGIYSIGENILFDEGKSTLRSNAAEKLSKIVASLETRYPAAQLRVYGYTDATGDASVNRKLAEERAEAVRDWLVANGKIAADRVSVNAIGEAKPVASNNTGEGRQQNRRVEIVARRK